MGFAESSAALRHGVDQPGARLLKIDHVWPGPSDSAAGA
jgi:hypothetical protein